MPTSSSEPNATLSPELRLRELERSEAFLKAILHSTHYGIASYEPVRDDSGTITDFRIAYTNPEVPANFGLKPEDVAGKTCREVYPGIFDNGVFDHLVKALETGETVTYEVATDASGDEIWLEATVEKLGDSVTVTSKNITPEKIAALRLEQMNALLQGQNKDLASFTYIASHDLQEPLRKIQMFTSRILENDRDRLSPTSLSYFENIVATAGRMQHLIQALLGYSGLGTGQQKPEKVSLSVVLKEALQNMEGVVDDIDTILEVGSLPTLTVRRLPMQQVFANLIGNAIKYAKPGQRPEIRVGAERVSVDGRAFWKIAVTDTGIGFDPQYKDRIFEVFQRLHGRKEYEGTGVGLAICKKILEQHGGFIEADGQPGVGAEFRFFIPA
ncbi:MULTISPECIES: ATP-binding protein [unclassified Flavobacterium]|uniref:ATP-binding protein n=1 Tax=unclassified Flavobacterium TaxID=196869 RepID=UPI001F1494CE|nr:MULTISPECIES: ATP-binding protein [unclassified Flavobacterium]UMY66857.1 ATP-binding protein [Flavobacterium sp. HJ-32-4]